MAIASHDDVLLHRTGNAFYKWTFVQCDGTVRNFVLYLAVAIVPKFGRPGTCAVDPFPSIESNGPYMSFEVMPSLQRAAQLDADSGSLEVMFGVAAISLLSSYTL